MYIMLVCLTLVASIAWRTLTAHNRLQLGLSLKKCTFPEELMQVNDLMQVQWVANSQYSLHVHQGCTFHSSLCVHTGCY